MARMFGTDGVRGIANTELTADLAMKLGAAGTCVLAKNNPDPLIVIGRDTRISGEMLEEALTAGILSMGGSVIKAGVIPTPGIAYLTQLYGADAGIVISASHNPFKFNGIKFFNSEGFKLDDALEDEIEAIIKSDSLHKYAADSVHIGTVRQILENPLDSYRKFVMSTFGDGRLDGIKIVLDCANGASSVVAGDVFRGLGADVTVINCEPDGININDNCGSTHPENLAEAVVKTGADAGLAFDGDADRLIACDEKGGIIDGDRLISIMEMLLKDEGKLTGNTVTVTVMSNIGFHRRAEELGIDVDVTKVGDRYVLEEMMKTGCVIGGEQSGHIILREFASTGDGMISGLQLLKAYVRYGKPMSELAGTMRIYPQVLINARVSNSEKYRWNENEAVAEAVAEAEKKIGSTGRVLVRPSGTEPLVRVMIEGEDPEKIRPIAEDLAKFIEEQLSGEEQEAVAE